MLEGAAIAVLIIVSNVPVEFLIARVLYVIRPVDFAEHLCVRLSSAELGNVLSFLSKGL